MGIKQEDIYDNNKEKQKRRRHSHVMKTQILSKETKQKVKKTEKNIADKQFGVSKVKDIQSKWSNGYQIGDMSKSILGETESINTIGSLMNKVKKVCSGETTDLMTNKDDYIKSKK